jgi:hypothetical protein
MNMGKQQYAIFTGWLLHNMDKMKGNNKMVDGFKVQVKLSVCFSPFLIKKANFWKKSGILFSPENVIPIVV